MTSNVAMLRCVLAIFLLLMDVSISAHSSQKEKRQVTYQADDTSGADQESEVDLIRPITKKPLPAQVVYPGDLTSFYTTETPDDTLRSNDSTTQKSKLNSSAESSRLKRSLYLKDAKNNNPGLLKLEKHLKQLEPKYRMSESRLHSSYHKPSVSVMNDIPAEMYFDGAGFLRYEDDSEEVKSLPEKSQRYDRSHSRLQQDNSKALRDFREAFNISHERGANNIKFDDDVQYSNVAMYPGGSGEKTIDHGAQETENGTPLGIEFLNAYQKELFENMHNYGQIAQNPNSFQQDPFSFTYPNFYNPQPNLNQMSPPMMQQEPLLQNHRLQSSPNIAGVSAPTVYASPSAQPLNANPGYATNLNYPHYPRAQRKRRSAIIPKNIDQKVLSAASEPNQDHYRYSPVQDQQDSSSGFIPITGSYNGGTIQLNFPIFGSNPVGSSGYPPRPPVQTYHTYSVPMQPEGRHYRNTMERFYHPSEARRYSYGILGSGNFEVIRGGVFPNDRHQGYSGGYQDGRIPYGGNDYGNYGTTEIILDGPIQGFQGFDNFPAHLINALSKHSELAIHPDRREAKGLSS